PSHYLSLHHDAKSSYPPVPPSRPDKPTPVLACKTVSRASAVGVRPRSRSLELLGRRPRSRQDLERTRCRACDGRHHGQYTVQSLVAFLNDLLSQCRDSHVVPRTLTT